MLDKHERRDLKKLSIGILVVAASASAGMIAGAYAIVFVVNLVKAVYRIV